MSLSTEIIKVIATGNDSTNQYSFPYLLQLESDLVVKVLEIATDTATTLTINTDYTLSGVGTNNVVLTLVDSGQAWLTTGNLSSDYKIILKNDPALTQNFDFRNSGEFFAERHEDALDRSRLIDQGLDEKFSRALLVNEFTEATIGEVKDPETGKYLKWDANGNVENSDVDWSEITTKPDLVNSVNSQTGVVSLDLEDLANVVAGSASVGDGLILNSDGDWVPSAGGAPVTSVAGKVGDVVLDKDDVGLSNVDNTSDLNKPISTATQSALNLKADSNTIFGYRIDNATSIARQASDVFVNSTTSSALVELDLGDPSSVPQGYVFSIAFNGSADLSSLSVVDDASASVLFFERAINANLNGKPVYSFMSTGSDWFQVRPVSNSLSRFESSLSTTRRERDGLVIFSNPSVTGVNLGNPAVLEDGTEFSFAVQSLDASFSVSDNSGAVTFDETKIDRKLDVGATSYDVYTFVSVGNDWRPFYGAGDGGSGATIVTDPLTGDGTVGPYTLSVTPSSIDLTDVHVGNDYQEKSSYSLSGNEITFNTAVTNGQRIEVKTITNLADVNSNITSATFDGTGAQTDFTLPVAVSSVDQLLVFVGAEQTGNFTVSGTTLTFNTAPPSGTDNIVVKIFGTTDIGVPGDTTVSTAKIQNGAVTPEKQSRKYKLKELTSDLTSDSSDITALGFNNLTIGKKYKIKLAAYIRAENGSVSIVGRSNSQTKVSVIVNADDTNASRVPQTRATVYDERVFTAAATTVVFDVSGLGTGNNRVFGSSPTWTWTQLEEADDYVETTDWD